jgi:hypothetical protein
MTFQVGGGGSHAAHMNLHEPVPLADGGYFARSWGTHPDLRAFDLRSQTSSTAAYSEQVSGQGQGLQYGDAKGGGGGKKQAADSRFDARYDVVSQDGSINTQ